MKIFIKIQKVAPSLAVEKLYDQRQKVQGALEENFDAVEIERGNVEVQWMWMECVQHNMSVLVRKDGRMNESH